MELKIMSKGQLIYIICTTLNQYDDCVIEFNNSNADRPIFVISNKLADNKVLLSLCAGNMSVGNVIPNTPKEKKLWVDDNLNKGYFDEEITVKITIKQDKDNTIKDSNINDINLDDEFENVDPEGHYDIVDYREDYLTKHNRMRITQTPIKISNIDQAFSLFQRFLIKDNCDKLIISFYTNIPDLDHTFIIDVVFDKLYVYGRTIISCILTRPDMGDIEFTSPSDFLFEYKYKHKSNNEELFSKFYDMINMAYLRCSLVSGKEVKINAFSNCKF